MKTRKKLATILAGLMTIAALAGCSTTATTPSPSHTGKTIIDVQGYGGSFTAADVPALTRITAVSGQGGLIGAEPKHTPSVKPSGSKGSSKDDSIPTYAEYLKMPFDPSHPISAKAEQDIYLKDFTYLSDAQIRAVKSQAILCLAANGDGAYDATIVLIQNKSVADLDTIRSATRSEVCAPIVLLDEHENLWALHHAQNKYVDVLQAPLSVRLGQKGMEFVIGDTGKNAFTWPITSTVKFLAV